jgi:hypothetical protein
MEENQRRAIPSLQVSHVHSTVYSTYLVCYSLFKICYVGTSVADQDPEPDPRFLGLPDPDPLVRGTDPDPSVIKQKKNLDPYCFMTSKPLIFVVLQVTKLCTLLYYVTKLSLAGKN